MTPSEQPTSAAAALSPLGAEGLAEWRAAAIHPLLRNYALIASGAMASVTPLLLRLGDRPGLLCGWALVALLCAGALAQRLHASLRTGLLVAVPLAAVLLPLVGQPLLPAVANAVAAMLLAAVLVGPRAGAAVAGAVALVAGAAGLLLRGPPPPLFFPVGPLGAVAVLAELLPPLAAALFAVNLTFARMHRCSAEALQLTERLEAEKAERRRGSEELREMARRLDAGRAQLQRVVDALPGVVFQYVLGPSGQGRFTFLGGRPHDIFGDLALDAVLADAEAAFRLIHPADVEVLRGTLQKAAQTLQLWEQKWRMLPEKRGTVWVRGRAVPERVPEGVLFTGVFVDVTEEERLAETVRHGQRLDTLGDLVAGIAHNFNNALAAMLPNIEEGIEATSGDVKGALEDARAAARSSADLVRQLMMLARSQEKGRREPVEMADVVRQAVAMCRRTFDRRITIEERGDTDGARVLGQQSQLQQIVLNLCLNARDAVAGRPVPRISVGLSRLPPPVAQSGERGCVELRVGDNGVGIPASMLSRLGEPFFTTKAPGRGTGLGLATVYRIVRDMGGTIEVDSKEGEGTTFAVRVPIADEAQSARPAPQGERLPARRVLVVDDDALVRSALSRLLGRMGLTVREAPGGAEALAQLGHGTDMPAAIILDLSMPGMSGHEVLARLREQWPTIPVVILSGHVSSGGSLEGAAAVLQKPAAQSELVNTLRPLLERDQLN